MYNKKLTKIRERGEIKEKLTAAAANKAVTAANNSSGTNKLF